MNDPIYPPEAYIMAHDIVRHLSENLAIHFQTGGGEHWDRETMQRHVNERGALLRVQQLLIEAGERAAGISNQ